MPGGFALCYGQSNLADQGTTLASTKGTVVTASGSINTKGAFAQLAASTPSDASGFFLQFSTPSGAAAAFLVDIAVGASGSEVVIIPNVCIFSPSTAVLSYCIWIPVAIPAGTRISARCQSTTASATVTCSVILADGDFDEDASLGAPQNYGALTASSLGTAIDPGATANTKGAWVQLVASTTFDIAALQLIIDAQKVVSNTLQTWLIDVGLGAAASEKVIVPNLMVSTNAVGQLGNPTPPLFRTQIPAGTRIAVRASGTNTTSTTRKFGATLLGYQQ